VPGAVDCGTDQLDTAAVQTLRHGGDIQPYRRPACLAAGLFALSSAMRQRLPNALPPRSLPCSPLRRKWRDVH
jgi:hypothetical protein